MYQEKVAKGLVDVLVVKCHFKKSLPEMSEEMIAETRAEANAGKMRAETSAEMTVEMTVEMTEEMSAEMIAETIGEVEMTAGMIGETTVETIAERIVEMTIDEKMMTGGGEIEVRAPCHCHQPSFWKNQEDERGRLVGATRKERATWICLCRQCRCHYQQSQWSKRMKFAYHLQKVFAPRARNANSRTRFENLEDSTSHACVHPLFAELAA